MDYVGFDCKRTVPLQSFLALSHSSSHARASALTSPPPDFLFISIHRTPPSHKFPPFHPKQKEQSLLVLPSVHTILNFATEFFEMFTKLQSEHPQKVFQVFQVFRVFQVFHVRFWTTKPPGFGPNPNKTPKTDTHPPPPCNGYGKHPKKQRLLLPDKHSAGAVFFRRSGFFFVACHIIIARY